MVSGASGLYIVVRARHLSLAQPNQAPWSNFLREQLDLIMMVVGGPMVWHLFHHLPRHAAPNERQQLTLNPFHQLRQVFTALLLGTGLLMRKVSEGKTAEVIALVQRLHKIARDGVVVLASIDEPRLLELLELEPLDVATGAFIGPDGRGPKSTT
jgi:hypothetical protein